MNKITLPFEPAHLQLINQNIPDIVINQSLFTEEEVLLIKQKFAPKQDDISRQIFNIADNLAFQKYNTQK